MARTEPFDRYCDEYDRWFEEHEELFEAELRALNLLLPTSRAHGLEIGVGSGRFASRLDVPVGVEPSQAMAERASRRGIEVHAGVAEALPFGDQTFDYLLMVTTICFVDDPLQALEEAFRVLRPGGFIVMGLIDRHSEIGRFNAERKNAGVFYRDAQLHSTDEVLDLLSQCGFVGLITKQTLLSGEQSHLVRDGYGSGSFVVIRGSKPS